MLQIYRRDFTNEKQLNIRLTNVTVKTSTLRSSVRFDWKTNCFIRSKQGIIDIRHEVRTLQIRANAL